MLEKTITLEPKENIIIKADESLVTLIAYTGHIGDQDYKLILLNEREAREVHDFLGDWLRRRPS